MAKEKILDVIKQSKTIDSAYDIKLNKGQGTNAASATRKDYVDSQDALKVNKAGDTMTGNLVTSGGFYADGLISSKIQVIAQNTENTYATRMVVSGSAGYLQAGKTDRDVADQKLILSGWLGTPLTMSKFSMANGVNPQVQWGSTNHDILHRGNLPNAADVGAVSKTGDTMVSGNIGFSEINTGISLHPTYSPVTGLYVGNGDGASQDATNIVLKSWYGIGISPTAGLLSGMTMGQNSIWINARTGAINSIGSVTANGFKSTNVYAYFSEKAGHGMYLGTTTDNRTVIGGGSVTDGAVLIRPGGVGAATGTTLFNNDGTITNSAAPTAPAHLTNKSYVDSVNALKVNKAGDTMTGNLTVPAVNLSGSQSSAPNTLTRKDYVDGEIAKQVAKTGDTMTGVLKVNAEIQTTSNNSYRQVVGNYGSMWRMDSIGAYFLLTNSGDQYGNYNALRPFTVALDTGITTLSADSCIANSTQKIFHDKYAPRITQSEYLDTGSDLNNMAMYPGGLTISRFGSGAANRPTVVNSANTILGINPTTGYKHQLVFSSDGKMYNRYNDNVSWSDWGQVYTSIYRPTPAEVGAVNKTGDTMTGNLTTSGILRGQLYHDKGYFSIGAYGSMYGDGRLQGYFREYNSGVPGVGYLGLNLEHRDSVGAITGKQVDIFLNGKFVYHEGRNPTPAAVGAVNIAGDTMTGNLSFSDTGEGVRFAAFNSGSGIYNGSGDGASQDATNIQIKSWQGIGISPTAGLPVGMTMGQNSVWINARTGDITTIGSVNSNSVVSNSFKVVGSNGLVSSTNGSQGIYIGSGADTRTIVGGGSVAAGTVVIRPRGTNDTISNTVFNNDGTITNSVAPTNTSHLTNKAYVDSAIATGDALQVSKSGDTMTGDLTVPKVLLSATQGTEANALTRKDYVDGEIAKQVSKSGDTMTGNLTVPAVLVSSTQNTSVNALTRKDYVDGQVAALLARIVALESK